MSLEEILDYARMKVSELAKCRRWRFEEVIKRPVNWRARTDVLQHPGAYIIYEGKEPIYVGEAGKGGHWVNYRMGDLFSYSPKRTQKFGHTLTKKLLTKERRFKTMGQVREFYMSKCTLKTVPTETFKQARTVEAVLIEFLKPKYND